MSVSLNFVVGSPIKGGSSKVRSIGLDHTAMMVLNVKEGDLVNVTKGQWLGMPRSPQITVKVIQALPQDKGKKIVRFTDDVLEFSHGEEVMVYSVK